MEKTKVDSKDIVDRYAVADYCVRYVGEGQRPSIRPREGIVFVYEKEPGTLYLDPLGNPVVFHTESEAFACRDAFGSGLVLSMGDKIADDAHHLDVISGTAVTASLAAI